MTPAQTHFLQLEPFVFLDSCLPQLCTKMQVWMYYLDVFFSSQLFGVFLFCFCILYCFYDFLCYLLVQMHQSVSVDE